MFLTDFSLILSIFLLIILSKCSYFSFFISFCLILSSIFLSECLYLFNISGVVKFSVKSNIFFHYQLVFYIHLELLFQKTSYINTLYKNAMTYIFVNCVFENIMFYYFLRIYDVIKIIVISCFFVHCVFKKMTYFYYFCLSVLIMMTYFLLIAYLKISYLCISYYIIFINPTIKII